MFSIYLDTSVISSLYDTRTPERLKFTKEMWQYLGEYEVYISDIVWLEIRDWPPLYEKSVDLLSGFKSLRVTNESKKLAKEYINQGAIPQKQYNDALHVAIASVNKIDYLISWNFKHLVRVKARTLINLVNAKFGYRSLELIAPPEL
jgi:predicted nucleic acid-binding protein